MSVDKEQVDFLGIDEGELHREWLRQPGLYAKYAKKLAKAKLEADRAHSRMLVKYTESERLIRNDPGAYGLRKLTEPAVKAAVQVHPMYRKAVRAHNEAKYNVGIVDAYVTALEHRKRALENLVSLWLGDYFSTPRAPREARGHLEEATKRDVRGGGKKVRKSA
jgi:hypothetical protein